MTIMNDRVQRVLEDAVYYFWVGAGLALGTIAVVRYLLPKATKARP